MLFESMVLRENKRRGSSMLLVYTVTKGIAIIFSVASVSRLVCTMHKGEEIKMDFLLHFC